MRRLLAILALLTAIGAMAADSTAVHTISLPPYMPHFHGTFRTFYEYSTPTGDSRFMVRNARLAAAGSVLHHADYFFQLDLCDRGRISILDAYVTLRLPERLNITAGQCRVPFSVGASRQPHQYHFANRATICKLFGNLRAAGAKIGYTTPHIPLYIEAGAFNGTDMSDHTPWNTSLTFSAKANYRAGYWMPQICFMSRKPGIDGVRINQADASVTFDNARLFVEAEYCYRTYVHGAHRHSHGYNVEVDYRHPVSCRYINQWSLQARVDGITDASTGIPDSYGFLLDNYHSHTRATVGATASYISGLLHCDFRLNYEQYFYANGYKASSPSDDNKLVAALVLYF